MHHEPDHEPDHEPAPQPTEPIATATATVRLDHLLLAAALGALVLALVPWLPLPVRAGEWSGYYSTHLWLPLWSLALLVTGGPRIADRPGWMRRWVRVARGQYVEYGGGWYGAMALVTFAWLEWDQLVELYARFEQVSAAGFAVGQVVPQLVRFGVDTFLNGLWGMVWPAFHGKAYPMHDFWAAVVVGAAVFYAAREVVQRLPRPA